MWKELVMVLGIDFLEREGENKEIIVVGIICKSFVILEQFNFYESEEVNCIKGKSDLYLKKYPPKDDFSKGTLAAGQTYSSIV